MQPKEIEFVVAFAATHAAHLKTPLAEWQTKALSAILGSGPTTMLAPIHVDGMEAMRAALAPGAVLLSAEAAAELWRSCGVSAGDLLRAGGEFSTAEPDEWSVPLEVAKARAGEVQS